MTCAVHNTILPAGTRVRVNGVAIPRHAIAREVQHHPAKKPIEAWQAAARALVIRELLLQEARRRGVKAEPLHDSEGRRETEDEAAVRALVEQEVCIPQADAAECRRWYEQNRQRFRSPDIYEAAHILFAAPRSDAPRFAEARKAAEAALAIVREQPNSFAELAREHSDCPSGAHGGNLGQITAGQTTPEFERALMALEPGAISPEPVTTRYGFHVIRLDREHPGRELPYEAVADTIAEYLRECVQRRASAQYIARLAAAARIEGIEIAGAEAMRVGN